MPEQSQEENDELEIWKIKKILEKLKKARGNGTSMISLVIPPGDQVGKINKMLSEEYSTASNIKSRANRLSVLSAIISTQQRLKLYSKIPENGLILYCGTILEEGNKEKKVTYDIQPFKAINTSLYLCDNKFHTEILFSLLENEDKIAYIIMDGKGALFGILKGNKKEILHKITVDLPKKHGRGGQSAMRFSRLRVEKRFVFLKKVAELANLYFIEENQKVTIKGLILAGSGEFKNELSSSDIFDPRLKTKILQIIDIAYGGEAGFNQAIEVSSPKLGEFKFIKEKKILNSYFEEISKNSGKFVFGIEETVEALNSGTIEKLICWENLDFIRFVLYNPKTNVQLLKFLKEKKDNKNCHDKELSIFTEFEVKKQELLVDWLVENRINFGSQIYLVSNKTPEGNQFVKGFGGLGGILRYSIDQS